MVFNFFDSNGASYNIHNLVTLSIYFFCHISCQYHFQYFSILLFHAHTTFNKANLSQGKLLCKAIVFRATLRILFFKPAFNTQSK